MKRTKQKKMIHIGNILGETYSSLRTGTDGEIARIWSLWNSAVGDSIAENSRPASFKGTLLSINVSNSVWLQHLTFLEAELIKKINMALGGDKVKELKFKIGSIGGRETKNR